MIQLIIFIPISFIKRAFRLNGQILCISYPVDEHIHRLGILDIDEILIGKLSLVLHFLQFTEIFLFIFRYLGGYIVFHWQVSHDRHSMELLRQPPVVFCMIFFPSRKIACGEGCIRGKYRNVRTKTWIRTSCCKPQ